MESKQSEIVMVSNEQKETTRKLITDRFMHLTKLPENYIRSCGERPRLHEVVNVCDSIPVIDMKGWSSNHSSTTSRSKVVDDIGRACQEYGFFQVINHGVPDNLSKRMLEVAAEFFEMPIEDRIELYSDDPLKTTRVSSSFNISKEGILNWRDYLRHYCYPLEDYVHTWPSKPSNYREVASEYCREVRSLVLILLEAISESLGLDKDFLNKAIGSHGHHMSLNYYPKCPDPELTYGLPPHSDPTVVTVLLQDGVPGLQVFKDGQWIAVNAIPHSFVVNVGDQVEVISNGKYKSVLHRAVVNSREARISIPTFYFPSEDAVIAPAPTLVNSKLPILFKSFQYKEYYSKFWSKELQVKMDNPIHLRCILEEEQKAFLGCVPEENLLSICNEVVPCSGVKFVIAAVKMVLGREFLKNENQYRVNTNITSQFLASLLDLREARAKILLLLRNIFKVVYLGDDIEIVAHVVSGVGIPWVSEVHKLLELGQNVVLQPFLLGLTARQLQHHRKCTRIGLNFLRKWFFLDEVEDGNNWLQEFTTMLNSGSFYNE